MAEVHTNKIILNTENRPIECVSNFCFVSVDRILPRIFEGMDCSIRKGRNTTTKVCCQVEHVNKDKCFVLDYFSG